MEKYAACLSAGGELYMSGFYVEDIPLIEAEANRNGLKLVGFKQKNNWVVVKTVKKKKKEPLAPKGELSKY